MSQGSGTQINEPRGLSWSFLAVILSFATLAFLYRYVGDTTWWSECLTVWPPFVWCAVFAPRAALLLKRRRFGEVAAVALGASLFLLLAVEWRTLLRRAESTDFSSPDRLRIVSWNVAGDMPMDDLARANPDVAFLQEIGSLEPRHLEAGRFAGYHWKGELDPGTLSRFPIERLPTARVGPWQAPQVLKAALPDGRTLLLVNVRLVLPAFVVAAASFEAPTLLEEMHRQRVDQFPRLAALIARTVAEQRPSATILCGDFNTPGGIASLRPLGTALRDVWPEAGGGWGGTMTSWLPVSRIDQCWVSSSLRAVKASVQRGHSDHRMLVVDLEFRRE